MPGLSATISNARDPLRGSKRPKSQFYGHYEPQIPIFGTSFSANFFSLLNMGMWGVQSDVMWCQVLMQPFQTQGTPSEARNGKKKVNFGAILDPKSRFLAVLSRWVGPLGLPCDTWSLRSLFKPRGPYQWLRMAKKSIFFGNFGPQIPIFGHFELLSGTLEFEEVESLKFENLQKWS